MTTRHRVLLAAALSALLIAAAVGYVLVAGNRGTGPAAAVAAVDASPGDRILFRSTAPDSYGRVGVVGPSFARTVSGVACDGSTGPAAP